MLALTAVAGPFGLLCGGESTRSGPTTYCNPIDIDYPYNFEQKSRGISYRSAADPVIVPHEGAYYLFATISGGWWRSSDLATWRFVRPSIWPKEDMCAPAALSTGGKIYLFQSTFDRRPVYVTDTPWDGRLSVFQPLLPLLPGAPGPWDPAFFRDPDTGRWFLYFGSSNLYPLGGIELELGRELTYVGTTKELVRLRPDLHGWERFGRDHRETTAPFIEGAWMTKHAGKYYLQYAAPGTEHNVYANGAYVGDGPLGPFEYAPNNPIAYKPGGFVTGAGHGNTFQDKHGNWWNTGTPWIAVNFDFERRIALFPAAFDTDGLLHASSRFGDFPHRVPDRAVASTEDLFAGWMLLSYHKPCTASSYLDGYPPAPVTDEDPRTFWVAATSNAGEWLAVDLGPDRWVHAVQVNFTDYHSGLYGSDDSVYTAFRLHHSTNGREWKLIADLSKSEERRDRPNAYLEVDPPVRTRWIRYEHVRVAAPHLAISDIRVFGKKDGDPPRTPTGLTARRDALDPRNAFLTWEESPGAVGYNVLWGIRDDKLYQTYQVFADPRPRLEIRALTVGQRYSFAVEAFNECGVSAPSSPVPGG